MERGANSLLARQIAGALDWYREAGIDCAFADVPRRWLEPAAPVGETAATPGSPAVAGRGSPAAADPPAPAALDRSGWPSDLSSFADWWLAEPWLDAGRTGGRVPPRGPRGAPLMVLVPQPEAEDETALLSGPQGRLVAAMLAAMGLGPGEVYLASALPRHTPLADWPELKTRGLGEVLAHHVALAAPQRILCFAESVPSLLGHDPTNSAAPPSDIEVGGAPIPLLAVRSLEGLLARPAWKADVWRKWLEWTR